jgi:hypothetical protein
MKKGLPFLFCCYYLAAKAQIVNVERERFTKDTTGIMGTFQAGFNMGKEAERFYSINAMAHFQLKVKHHTFLILGNEDISKSSGTQFVNTGFFHLRYNYKIKEWLKWEAFTQVQYNKLTGLRLRYLSGTGPRFKVADKKKFHCFIGALYMLEFEENIERTQKLVEGRFDGYVSFSLKPLDNVELVSTSYYQPRIDFTKDYRISTDNAFNVRIYKHLSLAIAFRLSYDSRPPQGAVTNLTYAWENRLSIDF